MARPDFWWEERGLAGEFDGMVKYGRLLRPGQSVEEGPRSCWTPGPWAEPSAVGLALAGSGGRAQRRSSGRCGAWPTSMASSMSGRMPTPVSSLACQRE